MTLEAAARRDVMREPAGEREANKRRGPSRQEVAVCCESEVACCEAEAACQEDKRRRQHVKRMRGSGGVITGVTQQPAGKQEANRRGGVCRQEAVDRQEDKKQQRHNERCRDNQPEAPANKRRQHLESWQNLETMRGGGCMARG